MRLLHVADILGRRGCGHSKFYDDIAKGLWTPVIKLGRHSAQPEHEVLAQIQALVAGASDDERRQLVRALIAQRKMPDIPGAHAS